MWKRKRHLILEGLDDNIPLVPYSYEVNAQGVSFYKADIKFDENGKITKISTGAQVSLAMENIQENQIREGAFLGQGVAGSVKQGLFLPQMYPIAIKTVNIMEKEKRNQLLNDLRLFTYEKEKPEKFCPNLVQLYGAYFKDGAIKLVLELMDIGCLRDTINMLNRIYGTKAFPENVISIILNHILTGVNFLHKHYHIHRDIKPENIQVNTFGVIKLTDFGISKHLEATQDLAKTFVGTPNYMSPERLLGQKYNFSCDIWSIGCMAFELATGNYPFPICQVFLQTLQTICNAPEPRLNTEQFSPELCDFVKSCLNKDPNTRLSAESLQNHPFILKYSSQSNVDQANWINPIFFNCCELDEMEQENQKNTENQDSGMDME